MLKHHFPKEPLPRSFSEGPYPTCGHIPWFGCHCVSSSLTQYHLIQSLFVTVNAFFVFFQMHFKEFSGWHSDWDLFIAKAFHCMQMACSNLLSASFMIFLWAGLFLYVIGCYNWKKDHFCHHTTLNFCHHVTGKCEEKLESSFWKLSYCE